MRRPGLLVLVWPQPVGIDLPGYWPPAGFARMLSPAPAPAPGLPRALRPSPAGMTLWVGWGSDLVDVLDSGQFALVRQF